MNRYSYALQNPNAYFDPLGLDVINNSTYRTLVLGGGDNELGGGGFSGVQIVEPGENWIGSQDGVFVCYEGGVFFKTVDTIDAIVNEDGSVDPDAAWYNPFLIYQYYNGGTLTPEQLEGWPAARDLVSNASAMCGCQP